MLSAIGVVACGATAGLAPATAPQITTATSPAEPTEVNARAPLSPQVSPQAPSYQPPSQPVSRDYVVGPLDVLTITSYDQPSLTGKFAVEADLTFAYPLIGRLRAGGLTLRDIETELEHQLAAGGFFKSPEIMVAVEQYRSQKIFVVGEVRNPGAYSLSGDMRLIEVLALAGRARPGRQLGGAGRLHATWPHVQRDPGGGLLNTTTSSHRQGAFTAMNTHEILERFA